VIQLPKFGVHSMLRLKLLVVNRAKARLKWPKQLQMRYLIDTTY
jgi:hypothetical protein